MLAGCLQNFLTKDWRNVASTGCFRSSESNWWQTCRQWQATQCSTGRKHRSCWWSACEPRRQASDSQNSPGNSVRDWHSSIFCFARNQEGSEAEMFQTTTCIRSDWSELCCSFDAFLAVAEEVSQVCCWFYFLYRRESLYSCFSS